MPWTTSSTELNLGVSLHRSITSARHHAAFYWRVAFLWLTTSVSVQRFLGTWWRQKGVKRSGSFSKKHNSLNLSEHRFLFTTKNGLHANFFPLYILLRTHVETWVFHSLLSFLGGGVSQ